MARHPFRKSLGLTVLYSIIIIGIFVLQFRNESVLTKNTGLLSVSLAQSQAEDGTVALKNTLKVTFKGISFTADEVEPAMLLQKGYTKSVPLELVSYEQPTPLSFRFNFSENTSVLFSVTDTTPAAALSVSVSIPDSAESLALNYRPASGFSVTEKTRTKLQLNSKNLSYVFTAAAISDEYITFTSRNTMAYYNKYDPAVTFSFASIESDMIISQKATYEANIRKFKSDLIASVAAGIQTSAALSEKSITAYVAEMASAGRYAEAVNYVPDSFKKGNKRTYLSSPFFNSLESMYPSLSMHNENMAGMISNTIATQNLNLFTVENLADYLNIISSAKRLHDVLSIPAQVLTQDSSVLTLEQATGILRTYLRLSELHSSYADLLAPVIENCTALIESCCILTDSTLSLSYKENPATPQLSLEAGSALIQLGDFNNSEDLRKAGYSIVNTVLAGTQFDANSMGDAYPVLVSNRYYPHYAVLHRTEDQTIWAWTCAQNISYTVQNNISTISVKFPKNNSHYMIISKVLPFSEIEIYGLSFHSDPRFESYNSSGFIYREGTGSLFIKSRHKNETELIRLFYNKKPASLPSPAAAPKPEKEPEPKASPQPVEKTAPLQEPENVQQPEEAQNSEE